MANAYGPCVVHVDARLVRLRLGREADKAKPSAAIGVTVLDDDLYQVRYSDSQNFVRNTYRFLNLAVLLKSFSQRLITGMPCKPPKPSQ